MEGCKRYGRFMLSRTQRNVPRLTFHIARINRVSHDAVGLFIRQVPVPRDRESGVRLEEAFNFRLRVEATAGVALKAFLYDCGNGFVSAEHAATSRPLLVRIADLRHEHPLAAKHPRPHTIPHLRANLLPLWPCTARQLIPKHHAI